MNPNEIADRLEAWSTNYHNFERTNDWDTFSVILRDLRSADEKATRLPSQRLNDLKMLAHGLEREFIDQCTKNELISGGPIYFAIRKAYTAAIDALAAALEKEGAKHEQRQNTK